MFKFIAAITCLASLTAVGCASAPEDDNVIAIDDSNIEGQTSGFVPPVKPPIRIPPKPPGGYPNGAPFCGTGVACRPVYVAPGGVIIVPQPMFYFDGKKTYEVAAGTQLTVPALIPILQANESYYGNPSKTVVCAGVASGRGYQVSYTDVKPQG